MSWTEYILDDGCSDVSQLKSRANNTHGVFWPPFRRYGAFVNDTGFPCPTPQLVRVRKMEPSKRRRIDGQRVEGIRTRGNWYEERSIDGKSARKLYHLSTDKYFMRFNPAPFYLLPVSRLFSPFVFLPANRVSASLIHSRPKVLSLAKV